LVFYLLNPLIWNLYLFFLSDGFSVEKDPKLKLEVMSVKVGLLEGMSGREEG
jgi:hypothetical protein